MALTANHWKRWEHDTVKMLHSFLMQPFNDVHRRHVESVIQAIRDKKPSTIAGCPVSVSHPTHIVRGRLLLVFLNCLADALIEQNNKRRSKLQEVLEQHYKKTLNRWPLIELAFGTSRQRCVGWRNMKIKGGDKQRWEYYYYPGEFVEQYGKDAAREENER